MAIKEVIDLVVPYVDSSDPAWQKLFDKYNPNKFEEIESINAKNRFRSQGDFFKYFFRCIEKNLPWINNVFLLVQRDSQVPTWINRDKVKIVYHSDFIPIEYLPTFNSTTIELFIWNIPGLSEKFIYTNDDIFILNALDSQNYFTQTHIRQISSLKGGFHALFGKHLLNNFCLAYNKTAAERDIIFKKGTCPGFGHTIFPYLKSVLQKAFEEYKPQLLDSISTFRSEKNINHMFYSHYLIKNHYQEAINNIIVNLCINSNTSSNDISLILGRADIVAIQDTASEPNIYENYTLNQFFSRKFSKKSKYEI